MLGFVVGFVCFCFIFMLNGKLLVPYTLGVTLNGSPRGKVTATIKECFPGVRQCTCQEMSELRSRGSSAPFANRVCGQRPVHQYLLGSYVGKCWRQSRAWPFDLRSTLITSACSLPHGTDHCCASPAVCVPSCEQRAL